MSVVSAAYREILQQISTDKIVDVHGLAKAKIRVCREFGLAKPPSNSELLASVAAEEKHKVLRLLKLKPVRSISGVSVITVMPKPYPCPKDEPCIYCPGGPSSGTPQSYTGHEPAAMRAVQHNFDPYQQVKSRIEQLRAIGHEVDKVELIIFGGTLTAYPREYLERFVAQCLNAMSGANATTIEEAQLAAESAPIRNSDIALETRPDYCKEPQVDLMLRLGATRVELGVQTVYDDIYELVNRGHTIEDVVEATRIAKDAGFAITYHAMPNLFGSNYERDLNAFKMFFEDERFKPDALKIYPTLVMKGTKLHELWQQGKYKPYPFEKVVDLIAEVKKIVPKWIRIQRIQRDIPSDLIVDGVKRGDLRILVQEKLAQEGARCKCIRCREVGHIDYKQNIKPDKKNIKLQIERYRANEGEELFLSFEDIEKDILIGLLRLRQPSEKAHRSEAKTTRAMLVRELHVYGQLVPVGEKVEEGWQHRGYGARLIEEAERISREEFDAHKVIVLAGIGTRNYYRRFGYKREGPYMVKELG
ncbi:MAG: tRNA uridine(34) 5-carboxymethylaminomethyl modification radical SAM/GNAT enzyme Elp3 [Hadesarchaea archaeon CG08_land_8_20_14_0_20_51_8]|nr:MAG: tRNA uridine(34) 5-carboxymethylaminomethyl modification radical SAM/GNAT enzyme Elp3 [Hadesarchaea archaeon CG08_land_8_20_14_0_20_51_8]